MSAAGTVLCSMPACTVLFVMLKALHKSLLEVGCFASPASSCTSPACLPLILSPCPPVAPAMSQALHESLLEVGEVFDDCARFGIVRSLINAGGENCIDGSWRSLHFCEACVLCTACNVLLLFPATFIALSKPSKGGQHAGCSAE
jgi:hypothetical protein